MSKGSVLKKLAIGAAVAGAAGYVAGVLTAPSEGKKTRAQLKRDTKHSVRDYEKQLKQLHSELGGLVHDTRSSTSSMSKGAQKKFTGAVDNARSAKDKLREVLSSVHEGEATDKDLQKALEDARHSLKHLKQFIKK